jgi:hypothetical protein
MPMRRQMDAPSDFNQILRLHRSWADRYLVLWHASVILLFAATYVVSKAAGVGAAERASAYVLLGNLLVLGAIWHAAGLILARIHMLLEGITLEAPDQRPPEVITGF